MSKNIFEIQENLISLFNEIEDNYGELTEDLEKQLDITQEEFKSKVEAYSNVIKSLKSDIELCKQEQKRLKERIDVKQNTINRIQKIIISAIEMFGNTTKTGTKFIDYGTGRISIRQTESVELNEVNDQICSSTLSNIKQMLDNKILEGCNQVDYDYLIEQICKDSEPVDSEETSFNIENLTEEDISALSTKISFNVNLGDLLQGEGFQFITHFLNYINNYKAEDGTSKSEIKELCKVDDLNVAKIVNNKSLLIK